MTRATSKASPLTHSGLPNDEMGRGHEEGWKKITGILAAKIEGRR